MHSQQDAGDPGSALPARAAAAGDDAREWCRFTVQFCGTIAFLLSVLHWRGLLDARAAVPGLFVLLLLSSTALVRPRWFRRFHRTGTAISGWIGQWMGPAALTMFYFTILTPLALLLRLKRHDPLALGRHAGSQPGFWRPAPRNENLERMF